MDKSFWVIVPAAGSGKRMQISRPKQYLDLAGKYLIDRTLDQLLSHPQISNIALGLTEHDYYWRESCWYEHPNVHVFHGGDERSETVKNGLEFLAQQHQIQHEFIMVHDAARPLISHAEIDALIANDNPIGALLAIPAKDTVKQSISANESPARVLTTLDRQQIWLAQTPQKFVANDLLLALNYASTKNMTITDESSALEMMGKHPDLVVGQPSNFKVTLPFDFIMANALMQYQLSDQRNKKQTKE
ncbi:2-C-methyl-D-erythritol 4-phosphate cytidylyltransferase [Marinomonas agarivorans]|nr:2-C-methyl-D-erythritol 4-phosphate cytidylyltransferase [Marinomonas agarivorans]